MNCGRFATWGVRAIYRARNPKVVNFSLCDVHKAELINGQLAKDVVGDLISEAKKKAAAEAQAALEAREASQLHDSRIPS